jgi:hypothetical protein
MHCSLTLQTWLQPPQFTLSFKVSAQEVPHRVIGEGQSVFRQPPLTQLSPSAHSLPQPPQFKRSLKVFVQLPLQKVVLS